MARTAADEDVSVFSQSVPLPLSLPLSPQLFLYSFASRLLILTTRTGASTKCWVFPGTVASHLLFNISVRGVSGCFFFLLQGSPQGLGLQWLAWKSNLCALWSVWWMLEHDLGGTVVQWQALSPLIPDSNDVFPFFYNPRTYMLGLTGNFKLSVGVILRVMWRYSSSVTTCPHVMWLHTRITLERGLLDFSL